ncbi:type II secretion system F family protein [Micromonospora carbonacea]|uniref:type II secretion system F family protein n=1 Tax=Micromonospora carbonacea TaxID=47853 RepID=UPI003D99FC3A
MTRQAVAAGCLVVAAVLALSVGTRAGSTRRLRSLGRRREAAGAEETARPDRPAGLGGADAPHAATGPAEAADRSRPPWWPDPIRLGAGLFGLAVLVVLGGWAGLLGGVVAAVAADRGLRRIEPPAARERRLREAADLPLAADLLAATMRAGAPVDRSVLAVADALGGPLADRLGLVGRTLLLGGRPQEAWAHLLPVPGAERLAGAALRSADSGAALAGALTRLADDLRADRSTAAEAAARRAGVLIVLPLGLCFLPAFILAGLVPVIVAVLGDVL